MLGQDKTSPNFTYIFIFNLSQRSHFLMEQVSTISDKYFDEWRDYSNTTKSSQSKFKGNGEYCKVGEAAPHLSQPFPPNLRNNSFLSSKWHLWRNSLLPMTSWSWWWWDLFYFSPWGSLFPHPPFQFSINSASGAICPCVQLTFIDFIALLIDLGLQYISFNEPLHYFLDRERRSLIIKFMANLSFEMCFQSLLPSVSLLKVNISD